MFVTGICFAFSLLSVIGGVPRNRIALSSDYLSPLSETQLEVEIYETEGVLVDLSEAQIEWGDVHGKLQFSNEEGAQATAFVVDKDGLAMDMTRITANVTLGDGSEFAVATYAHIFRPWGEKLKRQPGSTSRTLERATNKTLANNSLGRVDLKPCPIPVPSVTYFLQELWIDELGVVYFPTPEEAYYRYRGIVNFTFDEEAGEMTISVYPWLPEPPHVKSVEYYNIKPAEEDCAWEVDWVFEDYDGGFVTCWDQWTAFRLQYILEMNGRLYWETTRRLTFSAHMDIPTFPHIVELSFDRYGHSPVSGAPAECQAPETHSM
eukprot:Gregarina_sp_Pseudo_9__1683@NODE_2137_length_1132_cov_995_946935_g1971_i0_p1_GENE_NODE_2137_length_1132_cov_995_946935_g1971_i0NODE_2137_length_1132_cov_995_946935_g1971_i0_p1_ORF_typecomplete_len320_score51_64G8/PF10162_9/0_37G8/PF10162_9/1e04_NODE_2137_length_1132_cov_995_946935_g1971_i0441003